MITFRKICFYCFHPLCLVKRFRIKQLKKTRHKLDDISYLKKMFKISVGYSLNIDNPVTFNEKIQWLKLHYHNPVLTKMADKFKVREYVSDTIGDKFLIPLIDVFEKPNDIRLDSLPDKFVLKCNHNSGFGMFINTGKRAVETNFVLDTLAKGYQENYYLYGLEWSYKNIEKKIICEKYLETENNNLIDYKFWVFNGNIQTIMVCTDRFSDLRISFFDSSLKRIKVRRLYKSVKKDFVFPENINEMKRIALKLARDLPFVRVDLYNYKGHIFFGEMTFYPGSGFERFSPKKYDYYFGKFLDIEKVKQSEFYE